MTGILRHHRGRRFPATVRSGALCPGGGLADDPYDEVSVIFVAHKETENGLERTRRLFTTLNKTARPVSKGNIIALDEDDVMAIYMRRLIEDTELFTEKRIAFVPSNNMPVAKTTGLTTIGNLYDVLTILFTNAPGDLKKGKPELQRVQSFRLRSRLWTRPVREANFHEGMSADSGIADRLRELPLKIFFVSRARSQPHAVGSCGGLLEQLVLQTLVTRPNVRHRLATPELHD